MHKGKALFLKSDIPNQLAGFLHLNIYGITFALISISLMKHFSRKNKSVLIDIFIAVGDMAFAYIFVHSIKHLQNIKEMSVIMDIQETVSIAILAIITGYIAGIIINRNNFRSENQTKLVFPDWFVLGYHSVFLIAFIIVITDGITPIEGENLIFYIIPGILFGIFWFLLHGHVLKKAPLKEKPDYPVIKKLIGLALIYPFILISSIPASLIFEAFYSNPNTEKYRESLIYLILLSAGMALLTISTTYIPRKVFKELLGVNFKSRYFILFLITGYFISFLTESFIGNIFY